MTFIDEEGYVTRKAKTHKGNGARPTHRNWWLVKNGTVGACGISLSTVSLGEKYVGKKVRFKIEIIVE
jgi:hypothetical protein